jgi:hypothetical protein
MTLCSECVTQQWLHTTACLLLISSVNYSSVAAVTEQECENEQYV